VKQIRKHFTYANVMSSIAVFLILGGATAIAAKKIGTKELKANSITTGKIKKAAVTTQKIKDNAVTGAKVNESTLGQVPDAAKLGGIGPEGFLKAGEARADGAVATSFVDDFTSGAYTSVLSKTLTAPSNGFLFIVGTISAEDDVTLAGGNRLVMRLRLDATGVTNNTAYHELSSGAANDEDGNTAAASAVVPVSAGSHTVHLDARESGTGSFLLGRDLSVLFVPNGSGVTIPVP
jgi:hypothetical protein